MKKKHNIILTLSIILLTISCQPSSNDVYTDITGNTARFSDHKGKWVVINYWAIWCKPCIEEIPELNTFAQKYNESVALFSVNFDGKEGTLLEEQINTLDIQFPTLLSDPAPVLEYKRPSVLPTTVIFNTKGELHTILKGPQTMATLKQAIDT